MTPQSIRQDKTRILELTQSKLMTPEEITESLELDQTYTQELLDDMVSTCEIAMWQPLTGDRFYGGIGIERLQQLLREVVA